MRPIVARDLMTPDVLTVREDLTVSELSTFLSENEITGAPVIDDEGRVVGVVSVVDIARADSEEADRTAWSSLEPDSYAHDWDGRLAGGGVQIFHLHDRVRVRDIMNSSVHAVGEDTHVAEIAEKMLQFHLHRLLVIEDDCLVGIISTSDLLGLLVDES